MRTYTLMLKSILLYYVETRNELIKKTTSSSICDEVGEEKSNENDKEERNENISLCKVVNIGD